MLRVRDLTDVPYLAETPARGPGADMVGRSAGLLVDLPVELTPHGWRLSARPGRDLARTASLLRQELDAAAEVYADHAGPLKVAVCGPVTLAAALWLPSADRAVADPGAVRDLADSLAEGVASLLARLQDDLPAAELWLQVDEPGLTAVLQGSIPTFSGMGRLRALDPTTASQTVATVMHAGRAVRRIAHTCAGYEAVTWSTLAGAQPDALALDARGFGASAWEAVAEAVDTGMAFWPGLTPAEGPEGPGAAASQLAAAWTRVGLSRAGLADLVVSPPCGLATLTAPQAVTQQRGIRDLARALEEESTR